MQLQPGDHVVTPSGEHGRVVLVSRLTVFVKVEESDVDETIRGYLESQLTKATCTERCE